MPWVVHNPSMKPGLIFYFSPQIYYVLAVIADLIFRSLWTLNISVGEAGAQLLEGNILGTILAIIEVFRCVGQLLMGEFNHYSK